MLALTDVKERHMNDLEKVANYLLETSEYYQDKAEELGCDVYDLFDEALEEAENLSETAIKIILNIS
jgi:hypothetical protein